MRPINAMIVGAQKAGTTSLAFYLGQHPRICTHRRHELSYFVDEADYGLGYADNFRRYFDQCSNKAFLLGKSVTVMTRAQYVLRLREHNPAMRLIVVLRNPTERAYSAYWWARRMGHETLPTFQAALDADPARHRGNAVKVHSTSYLRFGEYARQLESLFGVFGRARVQVHLFEDLQEHARSVCRQTFAFLEVDPFEPIVGARRNTSSLPRSATVARLLSAQHPLKRTLRRLLPVRAVEEWRLRAERWNRIPFLPPPLDPVTQQRLVAYYAPLNEQLADLIGRDLTAWNRPRETAPADVGDRRRNDSGAPLVGSGEEEI